jgi:hypothetical protein
LPSGHLRSLMLAPHSVRFCWFIKVTVILSCS